MKKEDRLCVREIREKEREWVQVTKNESTYVRERERERER